MIVLTLIVGQGFRHHLGFTCTSRSKFQKRLFFSRLHVRACILSTPVRKSPTYPHWRASCYICPTYQGDIVILPKTFPLKCQPASNVLAKSILEFWRGPNFLQKLLPRKDFNSIVGDTVIRII
jgi:hypothetical protein